MGAAVIALIGIATPLAIGQLNGGDEPGSGLVERAAGEAERAVMLDLRMRSEVLREDYEAAGAALNLIRELAPNDTGLIRRGIEAAFSGGDTELMESLTRELVGLDPEDTVAQLRLISMMIGRLQTVEQRVAAYERFLGERGRRLDPSVRSRLALDAALLQRELMNQERFVELLSRAVSLDSTNKDAASMAAQFFAARIADPMGRLELQVNLLYADPVDPNVHAAISRELLSEGAIEQARRFFKNSAIVARMLGRDDEALLVKQLELEFLINEPGNVADTLQRKLAELKIKAQQRMDYLISMDLPLDGEKEPENVRLDRRLEFLRLLAADAAGREQQRRDSLDGLTLTNQEEIEMYFKAGSEATDPLQRAAFIRELVSRFVQLQIVRLMLEMDTEQVEEDLAQLSTRLEGIEAVGLVIAPWMALSDGEPGRALELLEQTPATPIADLCAGIAYGRLDQTDLAVERLVLASNTLNNPGLGAWARRRAMELGGVDSVLTERGREMAEFAQRVPVWIDRMISDPSSFMLMRVEPLSTGVAGGEPPRLRIRIENIAPIPLGFGADRTISSRLLISPRLDLEAAGFVGEGQPEIVELDQRLRLRPGEGVTVVVEADSGYTGWMLGSNAHVTMRERWRVMQDFWIGGSGAIESGAVALTANTVSVRRWASSLTGLSIAELTTRVEEEGQDGLPELLVAVRTVLMHEGFASVRQGGVEELVAALSGRFVRAGSPERVLMLAMLPHGGQVRAMKAFDTTAIDSVTRAPGSELAMALLTRVTDPEESILVEGVSSGDRSLSVLAGVLRSRLRDGRETLSQVGGGYDELGGLTPARFVEDGG